MTAFSLVAHGPVQAGAWRRFLCYGRRKCNDAHNPASSIIQINWKYLHSFIIAFLSSRHEKREAHE